MTKVSPGQTAEPIEMKLGTDVCPGQTSIVLDGDPSPPREVGQMGGGGLTLMLEYLENGERYDVGLNGGPIGKYPWAVAWHHQI